MTVSLLTYRDAYEHLLDVYHQNGKDSGTQNRRIRRAIFEAYRLLPTLHDWRYFQRTGQIITREPVTFSASYVPSTKRATISSGSWPEDVRLGHLLINDRHYPVARQISDTVIELQFDLLDDPINISGCWQQHRYLLPVDVGEIIELYDSDHSYGMHRVSPSDSFWWQQVRTSSVDSNVWSMIPSSDYPGRWELWVTSPGESSRDLRFLYSARHLTPAIDEVSAGTVSIVGDEATFTSGILKINMVGAVLRLSVDAEVPTSLSGRLVIDRVNNTQEDVLHPPEQEFIISQVENQTTAFLNTSVPTSVATRGYTISSHMDLNIEGMWEFFLRLCEEQYDIVTRAEVAIIAQTRRNRMHAMRAAMASDGPRITNHKRSHYTLPTFIDEEEGGV